MPKQLVKMWLIWNENTELGKAKKSHKKRSQKKKKNPKINEMDFTLEISNWQAISLISILCLSL